MRTLPMTPPFAYDVCFYDNNAQVEWRGLRFNDLTEFDDYVKDEVTSMVTDAEVGLSFATEIQAIATTEMGKDLVSKILSQDVIKVAWEVGESMAQCLLGHTHGIQWPWNNERDKRVPLASLPGADLIGFVRHETRCYLAFGEVKTSEQNQSPPNVIYGRGGMTNQIDVLATSLSVQTTLLKWLRARCHNTQYWPLYKEAVDNYINSGGKAVHLFGVLMRDTTPNELDLKNRALSLTTKISDPTRIELIAWYSPRSINDWPALIVRRE